MNSTPDALRTHILRLLDWRDAHVDFETAIEGIPAELRGVQPEGLPYSPWQLLEHLRIAQRDILEFSQNPDYTQPAWPDEYWPSSPEPPDPNDWDESVTAFQHDLEALKKLATETKTNLFDAIPHGSGQTYLRELLLVADHNAYHIGQLVAVRRLLGAWPPE